MVGRFIPWLRRPLPTSVAVATFLIAAAVVFYVDSRAGSALQENDTLAADIRFIENSAPCLIAPGSKACGKAAAGAVAACVEQPECVEQLRRALQGAQRRTDHRAAEGGDADSSPPTASEQPEGGRDPAPPSPPPSPPDDGGGPGAQPPPPPSTPEEPGLLDPACELTEGVAGLPVC